MSEARKNLGLGALLLLPIVCCIGALAIAAAGVSVALAAWVGGVAVGAVALVAVALVLVVRLRRRHRPPVLVAPDHRSRS